MPDPVSNITEGTVGGLECEISMNKILVRIDDARITRLVMRRYNSFREGIRRLNPLLENDKGMWNAVLNLWRRDQFEKAQGLKDKLPEDLYTHLLCCMTARYRIAMIEAKAVEHCRPPLFCDRKSC